MRRSFLFNVLFFIALSSMASQYLQYVDPFIGTGFSPNVFRAGDSQLGQTIPAVLVPNGMNFWTAQTESSERKGVSPYYFSSTSFQGFRASHWIVGGCTQDYGSVTIMPLLDTLKCLPEERASHFIHNEEIARPDYYSISLFDRSIKAEMTGMSHTGIFRFTFRKSGIAYFVINPNSDEGEGSIFVDAANGIVTGSNPVHRIYQGWGGAAGFSGWFLVKVKNRIVHYGTYEKDMIHKGDKEISHKPSIGAYISFPVKEGETVLVKMSTSFCDLEGAGNNMEAEIPGWDFDQVRESVQKIWEHHLSAIQVSTKKKDALIKFYTSMYHASFLPHALSDVDGRYPSFAGGKKIKRTNGIYYGDFSLWDTYRALHPLLTILYPQQTGDMIQSLIDKYDDGGWLPIFPCWNSYTSEMIGDHCASLIADAYLKGIRNFDVEKAYEALRKNAFEEPSTYQEYKDGKGRRALWSYQKYGYIPLEDSVSEAFHTCEQVSRTMEYAYDDHALSMFAKALGYDSDATVLAQRSLYYKNVIDRRTGYVQGRHADGSFLNDNNAFMNCSFITEGYPCHYTWYVPHDVYGLMECMGGKDHFVSKLDSMFSEKRYWHGNEPCHQVAFMYNYAGEPWKTQEQIRRILLEEYRTGSDGLSGNDDAGQMSAWYIFGALGLYPVCPVDGYYVLASPSFSRAVFRLPNGKEFIMNAQNASEKNIYIQDVYLNGRKYNKNYILHQDIISGSVITFKMGSKPNKKWGAGHRDCPPTYLGL